MTHPSDRPPFVLGACAPCVKLLQFLPLDDVERALCATGRAGQRCRRLPAVLVVYLLLAAALFRSIALVRLVPLLGLSVPRAGRFEVAASALTAARKRLGAAPLRALLGPSSAASPALVWRAWRVLALDGTSLRVPDTPANRGFFGGHHAGNGDSAYPLLRVSLLVDVVTRHVVDAICAPFEVAETTLSQQLLPSLVTRSLVLLDAGYYHAPFLHALGQQAGDIAWVLALPAHARYRVVRRLGPGDVLAEFRPAARTLRRHPTLPPVWYARVVLCHEPGFRPRRLATSLRDPATAPRTDLGALYRARWQIESTLADLKTRLLEREEALRSRTSLLCEQEVYALLLAYNVLRTWGREVADLHAALPQRIGFVALRDQLRAQWLSTVRRADAACVPAAWRLLPRREGRRCPREVKLGRSPYAPKRLRRSAAEWWVWRVDQSPWATAFNVA